MSGTTTHYAHGTSVTYLMPWATYVTAVAMCADGKVRRMARVSSCADNAFRIKASVCIQGTTVSGSIGLVTKSGLSTPSDNDPAYVRFYASRNGINYDLLPEPGDKPKSHLNKAEHVKAKAKAKAEMQASHYRDGLGRRRGHGSLARSRR